MKVSIRIPDPILRSYLKSSYKLNSDGSIDISSNTITGGVINAVVKASDQNNEENTSDDIIIFNLALSYYTASYRNRFLTIDIEGERQVNNVLLHEFDTTLLNFCNIRVSRGEKLKEALLDFMETYELIDNVNFETIKKRHYRAQIEAINNLYSKLRKRTYRLTEKFEKK